MKLIDNPRHLDSIDATDSMYPTIATWIEQPISELSQRCSTIFGYVIGGECTIAANGQMWSLLSGNYFAFTGEISVVSCKPAERPFRMWTVERLGYQGIPMMGQVEQRGRLSYIDGCSDSILVPMPRKGDPVLNYLHFPSGVIQTQHTHPSIRMGLVIKGVGEAWQEKSNFNDGWVKPLMTGAMFMLEEQELHSFRTSADMMDVIAYHPDSDTGPTDEDHAMLNKTYINHGK